MVADSTTPHGDIIRALAPPQPGETIQLEDGTPCVVERVAPPPDGSHVVKGIVYATRA